jgi:AraC family transcriptional regulator
LNIQADPDIDCFGRFIYREMQESGPASRLMLDGLTLILSVHMVRRRSNRSARQRLSRGGLAPHILRRVIDYLDTSLLADPGLVEIAAISGLSVKHFARAFKQSTGTAPHQWIIRHRVERAKSMLGTGEYNLAGVALACGFADQSHFTSTFRKITGMTPAAYKRETRL